MLLDYEDMFSEASAFNQDLTGWCVSNYIRTIYFCINSALTEANKPLGELVQITI